MNYDDRFGPKWLVFLGGALVALAALTARTCKGQEIGQAAARIELGRELFFERALSIDYSTACADCHDPERGYTDGKPVAVGLRGNQNAPEGFLGQINTPTALNSADKRLQFHDGRASSIADQSLQPLTNPIEMGLPARSVAVARLRNPNARMPASRSIDYPGLFRLAYGDPRINTARMADAISHYEATLAVLDAPVQRYLAGDETALAGVSLRGFELFKAHCSACHAGRDMRDGQFHNNGFSARSDRAIGRVRQTGNAGDRRAFATPTLLHIDETRPYMHNGGLGTLTEVVEHYNAGARFIRNGQVVVDPNLDPRVRPLGLSADDKAALIWFLFWATKGTYPYTPSRNVALN